MIFCPFWFRSSFQALYSYVPQNDDELELQEGDLVSVMEKCDDGWFVGESCGLDRVGPGRTGSRFWFLTILTQCFCPHRYVEENEAVRDVSWELCEGGEAVAGPQPPVELRRF